MMTPLPAPHRYRLLWLLLGIVGLAWPLAVHALLPHLGAWPLLALIALVAWWRLPASQRRWGWLGVIVIGALMLSGRAEIGLRLWPVMLNLGLLVLFAHGLRHPPTLIERMARRQQPDLPPRAIRYTRRVTQVWCVFFALNGTIALATALLANLDVWAWYNGVIAYVMMVTLFAIEWCVRQRVKRRVEGSHDAS